VKLEFSRELSRFKCCGVPPKPFVDFLVEIALRQVCIADRATLL
jgi:hypothetical protein